MSFRRPIAILSVLLVSLGAPGMRAPAGQVTSDEVRQAIKSGVRYVKDKQKADGSWPDLTQMGGVTALATFALLTAQVPANDPAVSKGLEQLEKLPNEFTYAVALKISALARADPIKYRKQIQDAADWLVQGQMNGGSWGYGNLDPRMALQAQGDNSNSQYALLGLHAAAEAGARVPKAVWGKASNHWKSTQAPDGGWGYIGKTPATTGSMTAAGVSSLLICGHQLNESIEKGYVNGAAPRCGKYRQDKAVATGMNWLATHFTAEKNPQTNSWHLYWLYGAERVGILAGIRYFGVHDWYREGAEVLINAQQGGLNALGGAGGSWNGSVIDTAFALLFLAKGRFPVLLNKLQWAMDERWNPDRSDCQNLATFIGVRLGEPVSWQVVNVDAKMEEWLQAPILYIQGHEFPRMDANLRAKLRRYVEAGGFIFAEACCSKPAFRRGMEEFARKTFPEQPLRELDREHPVWHALFDLKPGKWPLLGVDTGCRTSVIFSPRDLSCLWEQADVPELSKAAFEVGANVAAYATGREPLRDRLAEVRLPARRNGSDIETPTRAALRLAQISHEGDWNPDPNVLTALAEELRRNAHVNVVSQPVRFRATDPRLLDYPISYMTGHFAFDMSDEERGALKRYLERGGFLFAEACCGRKAFADGFEQLVRQMFPDAEWRPLPASHPILSGSLGYSMEQVTCRPALAREKPGLTQPALQGVEINGRTVIVFSRWGFGCGLEGHQCYSCLGYAPEDSRRIAINVVLYALTN